MFVWNLAQISILEVEFEMINCLAKVKKMIHSAVRAAQGHTLVAFFLRASRGLALFHDWKVTYEYGKV